MKVVFSSLYGFLRPALAGVCLMLLAACSTTGSSFDTSALRLMVPGQTTLAQASELLHSEPENVYRRLDGSATARWAHKASMVTDAVYFNRELWLAFDANGHYLSIVKSINIPRMHEYGGSSYQDAASHQNVASHQSTASHPGAASTSNAAPYPNAASNQAAASHPNAASNQNTAFQPAVSYPLTP